jgi:hypothetical protein
MKKLVAILFLITIFTSSAWAQARLGLQISTFVPIYRFSHTPEGAVLEVSGKGIRPALALSVDIPLGQTYYIGTGAGYVSNPFSFSYVPEGGFETTVDYKLQYVQIPLTFRMLTNEIAIDKRIYTQIGSLMEVLVFSEKEDFYPSVASRFNPVVFTFNFGVGMEFKMGTSTLMSIGLSYNRGISNLISEDTMGNDLILKKDLFGLDIGIRF